MRQISSPNVPILLTSLIIICFSESHIKLNCHQSLKAAAGFSADEEYLAQTTTNHVMSIKTPHRTMTAMEEDQGHLLL